MNIDCTLFAQMFNFFIAYLIMRWLLLKPAIAVIQAEADEKKRVQQTIQSLDVSVQSLRQEQKHLWRSFHEAVALDVSSIRDEEGVGSDLSAGNVDIERLSSEERENLIEVCAAHLIEKVEHVRK